MKKIEGYDLINEAGEFNLIPAGAYACKILDVIDVPDKEYLEVYFDIVEGQYKKYFTNLEQATNKKLGKAYRPYKEKALPFFKAFITAIEKTNAGYKWNWDEKSLIGKFVIVVLGEEEYIDKTNDKWEIKVGIKAVEFRSSEKYRAGEIKIPPKKLLTDEERKSVEAHNSIDSGSKNLNSIEISDDDLPF